MIPIPCKLETENFQGNEDSFLPIKAYEGSSAAYDLRADLSESVTIEPFGRVAIPTAVKLNIPEGLVGLVCPRSGLALKHGITVLNSPGIIDPGYINTVGVILANMSNTPYVVFPKDKVAQLLILHTADTRLDTKRDFEHDTVRGLNGFGSSGKN